MYARRLVATMLSVALVFNASFIPLSVTAQATYWGEGGTFKEQLTTNAPCQGYGCALQGSPSYQYFTGGGLAPAAQTAGQTVGNGAALPSWAVPQGLSGQGTADYLTSMYNQPVVPITPGATMPAAQSVFPDLGHQIGACVNSLAAECIGATAGAPSWFPSWLGGAPSVPTPSAIPTPPGSITSTPLPPPDASGGASGAVSAGSSGFDTAGQAIANTMCTPVIPSCPCGSVPSSKGCIPGTNKFMCPPGDPNSSCLATVNSIVIPGQCVGPKLCKATAAPGLGGIGNVLTSNLGLITMGVGLVLTTLMKGGGPAGGGGSQSPYGSGGFGSSPISQGCSTYRPVSTSAELSQPCTYYVPGAGTGTGTGTGTGSGTGTGGGCSALEEALGSCGTSTNASVSATPTSGTAPLAVSFTISETSTGCTRDAVTISYGDASASASVFPATSACGKRANVTLTHSYASAGSYTARLKNASTGIDLSTVTISVTTTGASDDEGEGGVTAALAAAPASGAAPLNVSIVASDTSPRCPHAAVALKYGDGTPALPIFDGVNSCGRSPQQYLHTYTAPGAYQIQLVKGETVVRSVTVNVSAGTQVISGAQTVADPNAVQVVSGGQTTTGGGSTAAAQPIGDIKLFGSGVTVVASTQDPQNNSTVAGFYGTNTFNSNDKSTVAKLCVSRPWGTNFLSYIIPPTFFDSLCSWRGYQVGTPKATPAATPTATQPQIQLTQQPSKTTQTPTAQTPSKPGKIDIWAVPASVPLGSRASIFWNAEGVVSCTETSPDGSFSHSTLKGGGSTVPITTATTFTMSCLMADGSHVTDYVTVTIAI